MCALGRSGGSACGANRRSAQFRSATRARVRSANGVGFMTCREVRDLVEAIAADDIDVAPDVRQHFESCPPCAAALAGSRRIEAALVAWPKGDPPRDVANAVLARVRNERWTSEQLVDRIFNLAIVLALLLVAGSLAALTNVAAVLGAADWLWRFAAVASAQFARQAAPVMGTYVAAAGVLISALVLWWWAERRRSL
jgi:hypothetical protein